MSFIPQITCGNCGTQFSALRGRCPNCGTPHVRQTSRTAPARAATEENAAAGTTQWQLIFGGILIVAVIVAVIILITASLNPPERKDDETITTPPPVDVTTPPPTIEPTPTPEPTVPISSITLHASWDSATPVTDFTLGVGQSVDLDADVYPTEARTTATINWRSTDDKVCTVDADGVVTAVGSGNCQIIADAGGVTQQAIARVP